MSATAFELEAMATAARVLAPYLVAVVASMILFELLDRLV